jgi:hypothetical protein
MKAPDARVSLWRGVRYIAVFLTCAAFYRPAPAVAAEIRVIDADTSLSGGVYRVSALINYDLTQPVREALLNGVELVFEVRIEVARDRKWWWDAGVADLNQNYELSYHALSEQFVVENLNTGVQRTFSDLASALHHQGAVHQLPLIDSALLDKDQTYRASMRAALALSELPLPIRVRAYTTKAWRLTSGWYTWELS